MNQQKFHFSAAYRKKSADTLTMALTQVPFYRSWRKLDPGEDKPVEQRYAAMPALSKADMRACFPNGLVAGGRQVAEAIRRDEIEYTFTSGTTGEKVVNLWNQKWWHASELGSWQLNRYLSALSYPQKQATLTSALNIGIHCEEDLPMDHRIMGNLLFLNEKINVLCIQERHYERWAKELQSFQPAILEANPSLLARLAYWAIDHGVKLYSPKVITLTYELPSNIHLAAIRQAFRAPVVSSFGTTETGFVLETCDQGVYHQNTASCHIDYLPLPKASGGPDLGRILVTTFDNPWSVIVRFDTGDLVKLLPASACQCGNQEGWMFSSIEGRAAYSTFTTGGKLVTPAAVDRALAKVDGVRDYCLEQPALGRYDLTLMVKDSDPQIAAAAEAALQEVYGSQSIIQIKQSSQLLPGPSGKYRRTHSRLKFDETTMQLKQQEAE